MENHYWDVKSKYILAFTVFKYGSNPEQWDLIANDLSDRINTTPQVIMRLDMHSNGLISMQKNKMLSCI